VYFIQWAVSIEGTVSAHHRVLGADMHTIKSVAVQAVQQFFKESFLRTLKLTSDQPG
jgi:hypothetical protein